MVVVAGGAVVSPCTTSDALRYPVRDDRTVIEADEPASRPFTVTSPVSFIAADPDEAVSAYVYVDE